MLTTILRTLGGLAKWFQRRALTVQPFPASMPFDGYRPLRDPTPTELLAELRNTAWTCAALNSAICASHPPRLYVQTAPGQAPPECRTLSRIGAHSLGRKGVHVEEVCEHPLLDLLARVNPVHSAQELWELTTLYQETIGSAYWLLDFDPLLGIPCAIWPLPSQAVRPVRVPGSPRLVDAYEVRQGNSCQRCAPERVLHFRYPDPREPYLSGLSPLRACWEAIQMQGRFLGYTPHG